MLLIIQQAELMTKTDYHSKRSRAIILLIKEKKENSFSFRFQYIDMGRGARTVGLYVLLKIFSVSGRYSTK